MNIEALTCGAFEEICYVLWDNNKRALVFDPGDEAERLDAYLKQHGLQISAYVCTHGHMDHINALASLHRLHPAPILMHSKDIAWAFTEKNSMEPHYSVPERPDEDTLLLLEEKKEWSLDGFDFEVIETPGHTPGSCCIHFTKEKMLIAGDTLFKGSCGRTDLPGGSARAMKASLALLKQLPDETAVFPGHGPSTTIGIERATNFFMQ